MPEVSVVIPAYNREKYIQRAIESALAQTVSDLEIIVVDDGSTDGTIELVQRLQAQHPRLRLEQHSSNRGAQGARNTGIQTARGNWIGFLDSDDIWYPESVALHLDVAMQQRVEVVHSACMVSSKPGEEPTRFPIPALSGDVLRPLLVRPGPAFPSLLCTRRALLEIGGLDESILAFQEWETSIRLARVFEFGFVPEPTFLYNCHVDETISKDRLRGARGYEQVITKHKEAIRRWAGVSALAAHYARLATLYEEAGEPGQAHDWWGKSVIAAPMTPQTWSRVLNYSRRGKARR